MDYLFECSTEHLTSERNGWHKVEKDKIRTGEEIFHIYKQHDVLFCLLYRNADCDVFHDFLKMSDHFPEISKDSPKTCSKIAKAFKKDLKIFRSYTNELKNNLEVKLDISEIIDIFTCEDMENTSPEFHMRFLWILRVVYFADTLVYTPATPDKQTRQDRLGLSGKRSKGPERRKLSPFDRFWGF